MTLITNKSLGNYRGNDVELCRTTHTRVGDETMRRLLDASIPFSAVTERIPFMERAKYHGAKSFYVIRTNPRRYSQARNLIREMDMTMRSRLVVSNY